MIARWLRWLLERLRPAAEPIGPEHPSKAIPIPPHGPERGQDVLSSPAIAAAPTLTPWVLLQAVPGLSQGQALLWAPAIEAARATGGLSTRRRLAMFLTHTGHESQAFSRLVESLDYSPDRLAAVFGARATAEALDACRRPGRPADQRRIANIVYGGAWGRKHLGNTDPGDGWRFRGRGLIHLTGRRNYAEVGAALDLPLLERPELLEEPKAAALSAALWWSRRAGLEEAADRADLEEATRLINGGWNGMEDRRRRWERARQALGV